MADYSRDPRARLEDSIAKHYVGVRMQQGRPLTDSDWNELEDLRKQEVQSLIAKFFGNGVPPDNDGFRIEGMAGGGVGTIVLLSVPSGAPISSLEIDFENATAASILGFLPGMSTASNRHAMPARLPGNTVGPFALSDGLTFAVSVDGLPAEMVTFSAADFTDISQATASEVLFILNAGLGGTTAQIGAGNDFVIAGGDGTTEGAGRLLVDGAEALNEFDIAYSSQPLFENPDLAAEWGVEMVPALVEPAGVDRLDLIYVDVWERDVGSSEDDEFVLIPLGMETTVRLKREWAVRVAVGAVDLSGIDRAPGHKYLALATLLRPADQAGIEGASIDDLRVRNLNVSRYLKTPIHLERGDDLLDAERYARVMNTLRTVLLTRLQNQVFDFTYVTTYDQTLVTVAIQDIAQQAAFAALQAETGNFNNENALHFLNVLYDIQSEFVRVVGAYGNAANDAADFIVDYTSRLAGLESAVLAGDLLLGIEAQEVINAWLSAPVDVLPEGSVLVSLDSVEPTTNIAFNVPFNVTYTIESLVSSPQAREAYEISFETLAATTWDIAINPGRIELDSQGGSGTVTLTVTPRAGSASAEFLVTATAERSPIVTFTNQSEPFIEGLPPPTGEYFQWISPDLDENGRVPISAADLAPDRQFNFQLSLSNRTSVSQNIDVLFFVTPPVGDVSGDWVPLVADATPRPFTLAPSESTTDSYSLFGPAAPTIGAEGMLTATATPTSAGSELTETILEFTFVVTA